MKQTPLLLAMAISAFAQTPNLAVKHAFEDGTAAEAPPRWFARSAVVDDQVVHSGKYSVRLESTGSNASNFPVLTATLPMDFAGSVIELRGWLKLDSVTGFAGLWARADGEEGITAFDNMALQNVKGTADWKQYSIKIPLKPEGRSLAYGVLMVGAGKLWADDLELLVDGKPVWEAPKSERHKTILDSDTEFNAGSKIPLPELSVAQVENLVLLGKVWGFAKYHHPRVTAGEFHWDYELIRALPKVLAASDRAAGEAAIAAWLQSYGEVKPCDPCAQPPAAAELHLKPNLGWIERQGEPLRALLQQIHANRKPGRSQFYVGFESVAPNARFDHESAYVAVKLPDPGFQLLAVYRFWNIIEYWFPYRNLIEEDWDGVLREFIPRAMRAASLPDYQRALLALIGRVHDTHANLWSGITAQPPEGQCTLPAEFRFVEDRAVVTRVLNPELGLRVGDIVHRLDGVAVADLVKQWAPYYPASNEPTRLRDIAPNLGRGACADAKLAIERPGGAIDLTVARGQSYGQQISRFRFHDRAGDAFQKLSPEVAYMKMSAVKDNDVPKLLDRMAGSKVLIIDSRNYPVAFTPFTLGGAFVDSPTPFARFTQALDTANPGAFHFGQPLVLQPREDVNFKGKVIVLVDEVSQSSSEYQTMAWSAGPRAQVIGSTTAAADGNVSRIPLPGGQRTMISGLGVFYPDKRPTQRVGIPLKIVAKPTIAGIREGRDEVLERALREALGPEVEEAEIIKMARPPQ
jgi:hypothetical protein